MRSEEEYETLMSEYENVLDLAFRQQILNSQLNEQKNLLSMHNQLLKETIAFLKDNSSVLQEPN